MVSAVLKCRNNVRGPLQNLKKEVRAARVVALGSATGWVVI